MASVVRPVREPPPKAPEPGDLERKERIRAQLLAGERIATRDIQPGEYFVQLHRALLRALNTAHRLTAAQRQYLGVLMEYSYGYRSPWAIRDMADRRPPSLADWCNWLGGWSSEQVCGVRKQLLDLRVIQYVEQNSSYIALNETWEEWDQELFTRHEKRAGAGRPGKVNSRINVQDGRASLICELTSANLQINRVNSRIKQDEFTNSPALIHEFTDDTLKAAPQEGRIPALNKRRNEEQENTRRRETTPQSQQTHKKTSEQHQVAFLISEEEEHLATSLSGTEEAASDISQQTEDIREIMPTQPFFDINQAVLFPAVPMTPPMQPANIEQKKTAPARRGTRTSKDRKIPPQNTLYAVWKEILPPATEWQVTSTRTGLAELANAEKTFGHPVTPEELPALMYQVMDDWVDRTTGEHYTPTPRLLADWLDKIRRQVQKKPSQRVRAWLNWQVEQAEVALGAAHDLAHFIEMVQAFEAYLREDPYVDSSFAEGAEEEARVAREGEVSDREQTGEIISEDEAEDFSWTARLQRHVPDSDGARHGRHEQEVRILWGFVRDELHPSLNTARRQRLDALTAAWDPEHRDELLLLTSAYHTADFVESTMLREINERVDKQLSRFFDRAKVLMVPQWVIDTLQGEIQPEEELATAQQ